MKLLLDENLSPALADFLIGIYPAAVHVRELGLQSAPDPQVWAYAGRHGYTVVTKDADFHHRSLVHGYPPKVIWIRLGNCSTGDIANLLLSRRDQVEIFLRSPEHSFLALA